MAAHHKDLKSPPVLRAHRPKHADVEPSRIPYSDVASVREVVTLELPKRPAWLQQHLFHIGAGMLVMLAFYIAGTTYILPFVNQTLDHWHCGQDRICQYDLDVGHGGVSHFITEYWHSQVIVIEVPHGDPSKTRLYSEPILSVGDNSPHLVTLTTGYISQHPKQGKPDLIASISGFAIPVIFYNTGDSFSTEVPNG